MYLKRISIKLRYESIIYERNRLAFFVMISNPSILRINNVSKAYAEGLQVHRVLKDVCLDVKVGEIIILLGKSGSGKSTLLNLISGIDLPDYGELIFSETDIAKLSEHERTLFRRKNIGFVFQFFNLIPTLTILENVMLPLELAGMNSGSIYNAKKILESVGLGDRFSSYPDLLSGGEQQRVAIARALVHEPRLILADEPTGNLDTETGNTVVSLIEKMVKDKNKTMLIATHNRDMTSIADRVIAMENGRLVELTNTDRN